MLHPLKHVVFCTAIGMNAIRIVTTIEQDGEIHLTHLPLKKGQQVEMIVLSNLLPSERVQLTAEALLKSGLIGLWGNRTDVADSAVYARQLREQAQQRD